MILVGAVAIGLVAGLCRALFNKRIYRSIDLKDWWLVLAAVISEGLAFWAPGTSSTRALIPNQWAPFILIFSQVLLLVCVWENRKLPGMALLGLGLFLNTSVIVLNGGMMPISPDTVANLIPQCSTFKFEYRRTFGLWEGYRPH